MGWRRWRGATYRKGQRWDPPWPFIEPPPLERPATWQQQAGRKQPAPALRRGQRFDPPWPFIEPPAPPERPAEWQRRADWLLPALRRGQRFDPPWPTVEPPAPPETPAQWRHQARRRPSFAIRHGQSWSPPWLPAPWIPQPVSSRPQHALTARRGQRWDAPPTVEAAPEPGPWIPHGVGTRSVWRKAAPRGVYWEPPWPDIPPPPPGDPGYWLPGHIVARRRPLTMRLRRGTFLAVRHDIQYDGCETSRPFAGVTAKASGNTIRPDTGVTPQS